MIDYAMSNDNDKAIGPVPSQVPEDFMPQAEQDPPFRVDHSDPDQQELAARVGWKRLEEIARDEAAEADRQRSPFSSPFEVKITPRQSPKPR